MKEENNAAERILNSPEDESLEDASLFEGFDIELHKRDVQRIDRLVDDYEKGILNRLEEEYTNKTTYPDRLADRIAQFGGSWRFITCFGIFLFAWMVWNVLLLTKAFHFDEPPFILLNLCLSFLAAFQAPVIMMSQNRQAARDKHESVIDFAINYKAELEIDDIQSHLHHIESNEKRDMQEVKSEFLKLRELLESIEARLE
ncbi:putative membrane protein [Desulfosporosinus acidiphilus SJ4]|uniref:Putative membrane protein n=1 Tax=Desulfosporosinus acidiphilus (strain DSM 22704 / JCM 16185 / SJ4) TaxID=646529 RepID=I4D4G9_DESAJ|nr:DUF1003 domain-containing protein [Desulfosporosinus acidiphilus]AFM40693.1 putative membrane protein [Desulfosporosinus acidiphilus SJ4]